LRNLRRQPDSAPSKQGTVTAVYETSTPTEMTRWLRDVAPPVTNLLCGQSLEVQAQVWREVTEAWQPLRSATGSVPTENRRSGSRPGSSHNGRPALAVV